MAERWYARLSKALNHELSSRQPVIFYADHPDFRSTSVIPGHIGETTRGVTEGLRRRLVMPLAGPLAETDHVLGHEMVHAFQFDITSRAGPMGGLSGALRLPLWFVEGMAEYLSLGPVDAHTAMWMRDAVAHEKLPTIRELDHPRYFPYRYGQAFWVFVGAQYGDEAIGSLLRAGARSGDVSASIRSVLDISAEELSEKWQKALRRHYEPVLKKTNPASQEGQLFLSEKKSGSGKINVSPMIRPDGKKMVLFSEKELFAIEMFLADAESGEIQRKITKAAVDPHFGSLQFVNSAGTLAYPFNRVQRIEFAVGFRNIDFCRQSKYACVFSYLWRVAPGPVPGDRHTRLASHGDRKCGGSVRHVHFRWDEPDCRPAISPGAWHGGGKPELLHFSRRLPTLFQARPTGHHRGALPSLRSLRRRRRRYTPAGHLLRVSVPDSGLWCRLLPCQ